MTKEEALRQVRGYLTDLLPIENYDKAEEIMLALEQQEPCEDAISRQAVLDLINADWKYEGLEMPVGNLPSVTPQPKIGRWIRVVNKTHFVWECDKCGWQQQLNTNYCPDCGAKMEG